MRLDQLRQQAITLGMASLSPTELLALLAQLELQQAEYVMHYCNGLAGLAQVSVEELQNLEGIGLAKAVAIVAAVQLCNHLMRLPTWQTHKITIRRPQDAAELVIASLSVHIQEVLQVILLDSHNGVMAVETVYIGSLNATIIRIPEIFRPAIVQNAAGIILAHNHPSGDLTPSPQDIDLTRAMVEAGQLLEIPLLDHLIIGKGQWVSLREKRLGF